MFQLCEALNDNAARHCVAILIHPFLRDDGHGSKSIAAPKEETRSATLTFVKSNGRHFAITCWHVIDTLRTLRANDESNNEFSLFTYLGDPTVVVDSFIRPESCNEDDPIDIAIRQVKPELISHLGKEPYDLDLSPDIPADIEFGYAVGFPRNNKRIEFQENRTDVVRMVFPHFEILAEMSGRLNAKRFQIQSELDERPDVGSFSGMSGGPIFWSKSDSYGLMGVVYEGGLLEISDGKTVIVFGEIATVEFVKRWIQQVPEH